MTRLLVLAKPLMMGCPAKVCPLSDIRLAKIKPDTNMMSVVINANDGLEFIYVT